MRVVVRQRPFNIQQYRQWDLIRSASGIGRDRAGLRIGNEQRLVIWLEWRLRKRRIKRAVRFVWRELWIEWHLGFE
jgi:hypothetical protein